MFPNVTRKQLAVFRFRHTHLHLMGYRSPPVTNHVQLRVTF